MIATPTRRVVAEPSDAEYVADPANPVRPASTMNTVSGTLRQGEEQQRGHGLLEVTAAGLSVRRRARHNGDSALNYCESRRDLNGTQAEHDRINALRLSQCSVRSWVREFRLTSHRTAAVARPRLL